MQPSAAESALLSKFVGGGSFSLDKCPGQGTWDGLAEEADLEEAVGC